jgi:hypothetical protein
MAGVRTKIDQTRGRNGNPDLDISTPVTGTETPLPEKSMTKAIIFVMLVTMPGLLRGQSGSPDHLENGKNFFWQAKFDSAQIELEEVLAAPQAPVAERYEAHLYLAFIGIREGAADSLTNRHLADAIGLQPQATLDVDLFPPLFLERFYTLRAQMVRCVYFDVQPAGAEVFAFAGDSIMFRVAAPALLCDLPDNKYDLLFSKAGYDSKLFPFTRISEMTDTLRVWLEPAYFQEERGKPIWKWIALGGGVAASGAVLYLSRHGGENDQPVTMPLLPSPPARPQP